SITIELFLNFLTARSAGLIESSLPNTFSVTPSSKYGMFMQRKNRQMYVYCLLRIILSIPQTLKVFFVSCMTIPHHENQLLSIAGLCSPNFEDSPIYRQTTRHRASLSYIVAIIDLKAKHRSTSSDFYYRSYLNQSAASSWQRSICLSPLSACALV
ncbi:hypothetical protein ALC57_05471, partial [Trachymyrmex cornetzi]